MRRADLGVLDLEGTPEARLGMRRQHADHSRVDTKSPVFASGRWIRGDSGTPVGGTALAGAERAQSDGLYRQAHRQALRLPGATAAALFTSPHTAPRTIALQRKPDPSLTPPSLRSCHWIGCQLSL